MDPLNLVLGSKGLLGNTLSAALEKEQNMFLTRADLVSWDGVNISNSQAQFFRNYGKRISNIFVAVGETNSSASLSHLLSSNFLLPRNLLELGKVYGFRVITFGTIHEESEIDSPYVISKKKYRYHLNDCDPESFLHFQLHTLYSSTHTHGHSFLGQIIESLKHNTLFNMSSGRQLREFHNVTRDVKSIMDITFGAQGTSSFHPLSHGKIITLSNLAESIFTSFSKSSLLKVQSLADPINEVYDVDFFSKFPINQPNVSSITDELLDTIKLNLL